MFPLLVLLALVSRRIGYEREHWPARVAGHVALAVAFGMSGRPLMTVARALAAETAIADAFARLLNTEWSLLVPTWLSPALYDGTQYLVLQALVTGFTYAARYRHEQFLRQQLAMQYDRARLNALRMQISPHFLYNTLSAIAGSIRTSPQAAEEMVIRLGDLFRRALGERDVEMVTLEQELDYAEDYLQIQHMRFAERLTYRIEVEDPALRATLIPPLLLQPLLENAVEHGLHESEGAVEIRLTCRSEGDRTTISVLNSSDGPAVARNGDGSHAGIGLRNVRERLEAAFSGASEFQFVPLSGNEYEARMVFPRVLDTTAERKTA
jgi:LytS/YehU family sensor histidine kinase